MSPRYIPAHSQSRLHHKVGRLARKHSRLSAVVATAVAAAGVGAIGASAGPTPWAGGIANLALDAHAQAASSADHATASGFNAVLGLKHTQDGPAAQPRHGRVQLDSNDALAPGFAGTLADDAMSVLSGASIASHGFGTVGTSTGPHQATTPAAAAPSPRQARPPAAKPAPAHAAPAHAAPAHHVQAPAPVTKPYLIYDSVMPGAIPPHQDVATYATGGYAVSPASVAGRGHVLWIDTIGSDPNANALDVEPGDATPYGAAAWVRARLSAHPNGVAIVYTMVSEWQAVKDNVASLPQWMQSKVRYWIADPTGVPHVLPGSNATQWYWGSSYDISTANPGFQS